jgi:hypothetical protein
MRRASLSTRSKPPCPFGSPRHGRVEPIGRRVPNRSQKSGPSVANLLYLLAAVAISAVGGVVLWLRNRKPQSTESGIDNFQKGLRALAPDKPLADEERRPPG